MSDEGRKPDPRRHWAFIVAVDRYADPALAPLSAARRDAERFYDWIVDPEGGAVPPENVVCLPAPHSSAPPPEIKEIEDAFVKLCEPATTTRYQGERLYIYMAGHGVAQNVHEASLLAADGSPEKRDRHVPGWHWLNWFLHSGYFDEVVLFADCCRTVRGTWAVRQFPLNPVNRGSPQAVSWIRGFAVQYGGIAIEVNDPEGGRGVFTEAILEAVKNGWDKNGNITSSSIQQFLLNHRKVKEWRAAQAPSIVYDGEIVFSTQPRALEIEVVVNVVGGGEPKIRGGPQSESRTVRPGANPGEYRVRLPRGIYVARVPGRKPKFFEVRSELEANRVDIPG